MKNKIVCVVNNYELFDKVIKNNKNLDNFEIHDYNNTTENISITKRYNHFIDENILGEKSSDNADFWCMFIHQDFGVIENIDSKLSNLEPDSIYGAVGAKLIKGVFFGKKSTRSELGFKKYLALEFGRILQGNNDFNFKSFGRKVNTPVIVDSVDCCCIIIHSSLIKKYNLRFDEHLNFHMYAEELCYRAKKDFDIKTIVFQMSCFHMGQGDLNEEFHTSAKYLKEKFNIERVPSTCIN